MKSLLEFFFMRAGLAGRLFFVAAVASGTASSLSCHHHQSENDPPRVLFENKSDALKPAPIPSEIWVQLSPVSQRVLQTLKPEQLDAINTAFSIKPAEDREKMWKKMNATTYCPIPVKHPDALISGRIDLWVDRINTYAYLKKQVDDDLSKSIVTKEQAEEMRTYLDNLDEMKPWQRKAIFELLGVIVRHAQNQ